MQDPILRKSADRGATRVGWLDSRHSFSFADYHDPAWMGFGPLRVVNEDWIAPQRGFGPHPHREMEILTFPIAGALAHRDSTGRATTLSPGRVQLMHAGRGIVHSERNPSADETAHLLQIWLEPSRHGLAPGYAERSFVPEPDGLRTLAALGGEGGALDLAQDARVHWLNLEAGRSFRLEARPDRRRWTQIVRGRGRFGDEDVEAGDGVGEASAAAHPVRAEDAIEALVFDLPRDRRE